MLQQARALDVLRALGELPVVVTDAVWDEMTIVALAKGKPLSVVEEATALLGAMASSRTTIEPGTPEGEYLARIHVTESAEDLGEHTVIAIALAHDDITPVLFDRKAVHRGVEELRGRVLSVHGFLGVLREHHGLPRAAAAAISSWICKAKCVVAPLWW
jgi:hypothetical protein